jgi:hypothetical protein
MMTMAAAKTASVYIAWASIRSPPRRPNSLTGRRHKPLTARRPCQHDPERYSGRYAGAHETVMCRR